MIWADNIQAGLSQADPTNAGAYQTNADQYKQKLSELDNWIREQVAQIPEVDRKLVTDHLIFAYFASRYGLEQVGAVVPSYSTMSEPSAQQLATLEDAIRTLGVKAVFVGNTVNPTLAKRVAEDTGIQLVYVYTDSLTEAEGPASNTLELIQYTVDAIVSGLK
jgi:ABC-type Zn uptake system ZnuABC Zn-binding protein ZnuA